MSYSQPADLNSRPIAVIGGGTLGRRIALMMASQGAEVRVYDTSEAGRASAVKFIEEELPAIVKANNGKAGTPKGFSSLADALKDVWVVFEAVPEILDLKKSIFGELDKLAPQDAILASNSSSFPSSQFIDKVSPEGTKRVVNTHFYMPPAMDAVEVMGCGHTDPAVVDTLMNALPKYGLTPYRVRKESVGLIFNRVWAAIKRESLEVVATGVSIPPDVDALFITNTHGKAGPFQLMDHVGLDVVFDIEKHYDSLNPSLPKEPCQLLQKYIDKGRLGLKTKKGFFDYDDKGQKIDKKYEYDDTGFIKE